MKWKNNMLNELVEKFDKNQKKQIRNKGIVIGAVLALIAVGALIVKFYLKVCKLKQNADVFNYVNSSEINYNGKEFGDECISSIFSNNVVKLNGAIISRDPMNLCIKAHSSTMTIEVPSSWNVKAQGISKSSNIDNETNFDRENFNAPLLFINYSLKKSNLKIKKVEE